MKAVVLLSGGLDSTVLLHKMASFGDQIEALTLDYGQLHHREIACARFQTERLGILWTYLDISEAFRGISSPLLGEGEIPEETYAAQLEKMGGTGTVKTYVPNRNMILLSIAAAHAISRRAEVVAYAAHMDDAVGSAYPDCTPDFIQQMNSVLKTQGVSLFAPFITGRNGEGWNKAAIVKRGIELGVDFGNTWSCYSGKGKPCGVCGTCRDRIAAFEANGVTDPLML